MVKQAKEKDLSPWKKGLFEGSDIRVKSHTPVDKEPRVLSSSTPSANLAPSYDDFLCDSYNDFCQLRDQGVIPPGIRFQFSETEVDALRSVVRLIRPW